MIRHFHDYPAFSTLVFPLPYCLELPAGSSCDKIAKKQEGWVIAMLSFTEIDEKIQQGYKKSWEEKNGIDGCDIWLEAWEGIKDTMLAEGLSEVRELEDKYPWQQFICNYVQDFEMELLNARLKDKSYCQKHITYCQELIERCGSEQLMLENTRRDMADSYFMLGNQEECDRLYEEWLQADPDWGWGYIGWSDCYAWEREEPRYERAEEILSRGLSRTDLRDRKDVTDRVVEVCEKLGNTEKAQFYRQELHRLSSVRVEKIGPNAPCPCGSGKKYKKCCGGRE